MKKTENCRELFLRGVTDAYLYAVRDSTLPIPCNIAGLLQMNGCRFAGEALHIATIEGDNYVTADSITAKQTSSVAGNGTVFSFEITAKMRGKDYYIVLRKQDDSLYLCYTLPGTFGITSSATAQIDGETVSVTATCQAMSEFIPIRLS